MAVGKVSVGEVSARTSVGRNKEWGDFRVPRISVVIFGTQWRGEGIIKRGNLAGGEKGCGCGIDSRSEFRG